MNDQYRWLGDDWQPPADFDPATTPYAAESAAAAKWWAGTFRRKAKWDNGEAMHGALAWVGRAKELDRITPAQADEFERQLSRAIAYALRELVAAGSLSWDAADPTRGSYSRTISVDYHAPPILMANAERAGIKGSDMTLFPCKTVMWIGPGLVRVRAGYGADSETVHQAPTT